MRSHAKQINLGTLRMKWAEHRRWLLGDPNEGLPTTRAVRLEAESLAEEMRRDARERTVASQRASYLAAIDNAALPQPEPAPKPKRVRTVREIQMAEARVPTWTGRNDDQTPTRVTGVVWWKRKQVHLGIASGGWALRLGTKYGTYLNTQIPDDITMKELAELSDLFRYHLLAGGYMGCRKARKTTERDLSQQGRARYNDAESMKVLTDLGGVPDLNPDDPIHAHLLNWMFVTDDIERQKPEWDAKGWQHLRREDYRMDFNSHWKKMTSVD